MEQNKQAMGPKYVSCLIHVLVFLFFFSKRPACLYIHIIAAGYPLGPGAGGAPSKSHSWTGMEPERLFGSIKSRVSSSFALLGDGDGVPIHFLHSKFRLSEIGSPGVGIVINSINCWVKRKQGPTELRADIPKPPALARGSSKSAEFGLLFAWQPVSQDLPNKRSSPARAKAVAGVGLGAAWVFCVCH